MGDPAVLRVGLEVGKAAGIADGIGRYTACLLRALLNLESAQELLLFDLSDDRLGDPCPPRLAGRGQGGDVALELDVFHSTGPLLPPPGPVPLVATVHDLTVLTHPAHHTAINRTRVVASLASAVARRAQLIAVSEHTRRELIDLLAVPEERVTVVPEAPDQAFQPGDDGRLAERLQRRYGIDGAYVLAVGSLEPRKNLVGLLDGMRLLPASLRAGMTLVVVGPAGWRNRAIRRHLDVARATIAVQEVGYVSTEELSELYRGAAVFAYPSLSEGFGLPVLEAMACGTAVVTSDRASLPEVAGDAALLVDPQDPAAIAAGIERLLTDDRARLELVRRGFDNVARFSWERCARETAAVYRRAAAEGRRP